MTVFFEIKFIVPAKAFVPNSTDIGPSTISTLSIFERSICDRSMFPFNLPIIGTPSINIFTFWPPRPSIDILLPKTASSDIFMFNSFLSKSLALVADLPSIILLSNTLIDLTALSRRVGEVQPVTIALSIFVTLRVSVI